MPNRSRTFNLSINVSRARGPHDAAGARKGSVEAVFGLVLVPVMAVALTIYAKAATENVAESGV